MKLRPSIQVLVGLALLVAAIHGWRRHSEAGLLKRSVQHRTERLTEVRDRMGEMEARRQALQAEWAELRASRAKAMGHAADLAERLAHPGADHDWSQPPSVLPDWNDASPFIWIPKDQLPWFPVEGIASDGSLTPGIAEVLTVPSDQLRALNRTLTGVVAAYHTVEMQNAKTVADHLPGIANRDGEKFTLQVDPIPEVAADYKAQYRQALVDTLGSQRAELLLATSESWLGQTFNDQANEPRVISLLRSPNGSYNLSFKTGTHWTSVGGSKVIEDYIPLHFRPLFGAFLDSARMQPSEDDHGTGNVSK